MYELSSPQAESSNKRTKDQNDVSRKAIQTSLAARELAPLNRCTADRCQKLSSRYLSLSSTSSRLARSSIKFRFQVLLGVKRRARRNTKMLPARCLADTASACSPLDIIIRPGPLEVSLKSIRPNSLNSLNHRQVMAVAPPPAPCSLSPPSSGLESHTSGCSYRATRCGFRSKTIKYTVELGGGTSLLRADLVANLITHSQVEGFVFCPGLEGTDSAGQ